MQYFDVENIEGLENIWLKNVTLTISLDSFKVFSLRIYHVVIKEDFKMSTFVYLSFLVPLDSIGWNPV